MKRYTRIVAAFLACAISSVAFATNDNPVVTYATDVWPGSALETKLASAGATNVVAWTSLTARVTVAETNWNYGMTTLNVLITNLPAANIVSGNIGVTHLTNALNGVTGVVTNKSTLMTNVLWYRNGVVTNWTRNP